MMHCSIHEDLFKDTVIKRCGHMFSEKAVTVSRHCSRLLLNSSRLLTLRAPSSIYPRRRVGADRKQEPQVPSLQREVRQDGRAQGLLDVHVRVRGEGLCNAVVLVAPSCICKLAIAARPYRL